MKGYDLHTHTCYSFDGDPSLEEFAAAVTASGLTGVAVTDHDTIEGALRLRDQNPPFDVIVGCEVTLTSGAHLIGLFIEEPVTGGWLSDTAAAIHAQKGLVLLPHPYRRDTGALAETCPQDDISALMAHVDLVEVFNAKSSPSENKRALTLAHVWTKRGAAGSDAHRAVGLGDGRVRVTGPRRHLSPRRLLHEPIRVFGIDQWHPQIERRHRHREGVRRLVLRFKRPVPETVWQWGRRRWSRICDHWDAANRRRYREYVRFAARKATNGPEEFTPVPPPEAVDGTHENRPLAAGRGAYGNG